MKSTEMIERFRRFASADLFVTTPNRMHQVSEILLKTDSVRIILTRYEDRTASLDVDIEVSLPFLPIASDAISVQEYIGGAIANLEYLKRLTSIGFALEALQKEGILIASAALSMDTQDYVFKVLKPPA